MIQIVKAKKQYKCDYSRRTINVGERYKRVNIRNVGIFHFNIGVTDTDIRSFVDSQIMNSYDQDDALRDAFELNGCF